MIVGLVGERDLAIRARASMTEGSNPSRTGRLSAIHQSGYARVLGADAEACLALAAFYRFEGQKSVEDLTKHPTRKQENSILTVFQDPDTLFSLRHFVTCISIPQLPISTTFPPGMFL